MTIQLLTTYTRLYKQLSDHFDALERGRASSMLCAPRLPPGPST
jgi:hypothetical protein